MGATYSICWAGPARYMPPPAVPAAPPRRQRGFSLIELLIAVAVFGLIAVYAQQRLNQDAQRRMAQKTVVGFNQAIDAAYGFFVELDGAGMPRGAFPAAGADLDAFLPTLDFDLLTAGNGSPYAIGDLTADPARTPFFNIWAESDNLAQARMVQSLLGGAAIVVTGDDPPVAVQVTAGPPGAARITGEFLMRNCNPVTDPRCAVNGGIAFNGDVRYGATARMVYDPNANLDFGGADLRNAGEITAEEITVQNADGTAVITADNVQSTSVTLEQLNLNPI